MVELLTTASFSFGPLHCTGGAALILAAALASRLCRLRWPRPGRAGSATKNRKISGRADVTVLPAS